MRVRRDAGSAALELIGLLPVVGLLLVLVVQASAAAYAVQGASDAVRQAARARSLDGDGAIRTAAAEALPGGLRVDDVDAVTSDGLPGVRLQVRLPARLIPVGPTVVVRTAYLP